MFRNKTKLTKILDIHLYIAAIIKRTFDGARRVIFVLQKGIIQKVA